MTRFRFVVGAVLLLALAFPLSGAATQGDRFYVTGHVRTPGSFTLPSGTPTVGDGIKLAGGPTERANLDDVIVIRQVDGKQARTPVKLTDALRANDTLQVGPRPAAQVADGGGATTNQGAAAFYAMGWINMPGKYTHTEGLTVAAAIERAGGIRRKGDEEMTIVLMRQSNGASEKIPVTLKDAVRPNDTVYVSPAK